METVEVLEPKGNNYIGKTHVKTYTSFTAEFVVNTLTYVYKDSYHNGSQEQITFHFLVTD